MEVKARRPSEVAQDGFHPVPGPLGGGQTPPPVRVPVDHEGFEEQQDRTPTRTP